MLAFKVGGPQHLFAHPHSQHRRGRLQLPQRCAHFAQRGRPRLVRQSLRHTPRESLVWVCDLTRGRGRRIASVFSAGKGWACPSLEATTLIVIMMTTKANEPLIFLGEEG